MNTKIDNFFVPGRTSMGWASANYIFDPVAEALIQFDVDGITTTKVLSVLIGQLRDGDWDTPDESLGRFRDSIAVVKAFYLQGVGNLLCWESDMRIEYEQRPDRWTLYCTICNDTIAERQPATVVHHNELMRIGHTHCKETHECPEQFPSHMTLIPADG